MALGGLLAACDRHSATEVPESYGHGSSHQTSFTDHEIDSRKGTHSFSDTQGLQADEAKPAAATPAVSPAGTTQPGFFPKITRKFGGRSVWASPGGVVDGNGVVQVGICRQGISSMLSQLKLRDFRCFETLEIELAPGPQFFTGDNAQGKTTILEAACVLLRLASPRSTALTALVRAGTHGFAVQGRFGTRQMQFYFNSEKRKLALDGVEQAGTGEFLRIGRLVYFGNTDLGLVSGSADGRRRFLDFLGSQIEPLYRANLRGYERALRSRNRLLKAVPVRRREVDAYDTPLLEAGTLLTRLRRSLIAELTPWVARAHQRIRLNSADNPEELTLAYQTGAGEDFARALAASRDQEARLRQTVVGPHRDDSGTRPEWASGSHLRFRGPAAHVGIGA